MSRSCGSRRGWDPGGSRSEYFDWRRWDVVGAGRHEYNSWPDLVLVNPMTNFRGLIDDRRLLTRSPLHSIHFSITTAIGFAAVTVDAYVLHRHWDTVGAGIVIGLGILIGLQIIYQWLRALRYYSKLRELYSMKSAEETRSGSTVDMALRIAAGGLTDILFYCYGMTLLALVIIGVLLTRLDGAK